SYLIAFLLPVVHASARSSLNLLRLDSPGKCSELRHLGSVIQRGCQNPRDARTIATATPGAACVVGEISLSEMFILHAGPGQPHHSSRTCDGLNGGFKQCSPNLLISLVV